MIIDAHCHYDMMDDPLGYIEKEEKRGNIILGMTNLPSHFQQGIGYIQKLRYVRLALGCHPQLVDEALLELSLFDELVNKTSYIGEIGLDFSCEYADTREKQIHVLRHILTIINGQKKIISVHSRKAEKELLDLLIEYDIKNVIFHWYSGPISLIPRILEKGYYFSVNEAMLMTNHGQQILKNIPKDRILTETDAPFNSNTNTKKILTTLQIQENDIRRNFMTMIAKIR